MILSRVMQARLSGVGNSFAYSIHLYARMLPWMFVEIVNCARNASIDNVNPDKRLGRLRLRLPGMANFVGVAWLQTTVRSLP
ncbi:hypothetical protein WL48_19300 [Burkholderia ubonensis]|uniref:hypothetical protein n=1 Tax=Burkholderia ubonensis TaxID=101571 RepID=UPI00075C2C3C|nr:hypothetical protein [Burkholderia ubonensis]KWC34189.1 hypothetical protein WL48_19300 [Burkholderia ubonensis]KWC43756.1 hypothetical protein WL49_13440 [Burkholderia ubonensis]